MDFGINACDRQITTHQRCVLYIVICIAAQDRFAYGRVRDRIIDLRFVAKRTIKRIPSSIVPPPICRQRRSKTGQEDDGYARIAIAAICLSKG